ncbi:MAG: hypothetical protein ACXVY3_01995 [Gaiellaceae bacterium]
MRFFRFVPSGLLSAALALALVACGGAAERPTVDFDPVAAAIVNTRGGQTMHVSESLSMEAPAPAGSMTMTAQGEVDVPHNASAIEIDMSSLASRLGSSNPGWSFAPSDWKMEVVQQGMVAYMRWPFLTKMAKLDRPWIKLDYEKGLKQMGIDMSALPTAGGNDPSQSLEYLLGSNGAQNLGTETIGGVPTTHWRTRIDFDLYLDRLPADKRDAARKALDNLQKLGHYEYEPVEVWIDAFDRVCRLQMGFSYEVGGQQMRMVEATSFFDYGVPVSITVPGPDEVADLTALMRSGG